MANEIYIPENPHTALRNKIQNTILESNKEWLLITFNATGSCIDPNGYKRQVVGEHSISRFMNGVDWTIFHIRRKFHRPNLRFIPFKGGDVGDRKNKRVNFHVHAYLEIPNSQSKDKLIETLVNQWPVYIKRSYQFDLISHCYTDTLVKDVLKSSIWYNQRYEGNSFHFGTEKIFPCKSCLF